MGHSLIGCSAAATRAHAQSASIVSGLRWWRSAAEQGLAAAQFNLRRSLANGRGVPQNLVEAYMWLSLAAARLPPGQVSELAVRGRDAVRASMTLAQIAEAQRLAREWDAAHPPAH
jgi:TPR repeat protein